MGKKDKSNFKTPEGYFDNFNERLMQKLHADEAIEKLSYLPESDGFHIPKGYFKSVDKKVLSQIREKDTKVIQLSSYRKYFYGAAAVAAALLLFFGLNLQKESPVAFEDLASAEIDAYLENTELDLTYYEWAELVSLEDAELSDVMDTPLETENILEYLDENIEDIEELNLNFEDYE
ncbi:hypothetical protein ACOKFD_05155 [Flagellimonas sp. S174]|uniref:hypothetical protein n=1 Tax=Flagellimonas sp. S174 TaxID=3410790 RepID=UPI003BF4983A